MSFVRNNRFLVCLLVFIATCILMVARRPDLITNPQFWAEDGKIWYAQAHNLGWINSLLLPQNGYYQTISKLAAAFSLNFSISSAPLVMNLTAIFIRAALVVFILSGRISCLNQFNRILVGLFIIFMPHLEEVHANITNTHWYLSIYLFFVMIADERKCLSWKIHDFVILLMSGLSGPFIVFLSPIIILRNLSVSEGSKLKERVKLFISSLKPFDFIFGAICLLQIATILTSTTDARSSAPLGASISVLANILSSKIFLGFAINEKESYIIWNYQLVNFIISFIGTALLILLLTKGGWRERSMVIFPVLMLAAALAKPMIHLELPQWPRIQFGPGQRYFVITNIFWVAILLSLSQMSNKIASFISSFLMLLVIVVLSYKDFSIHRLPDNRWDKQVVRYNDTKKGDRVNVEINPKGWSMELIK